MIASVTGTIAARRAAHVVVQTTGGVGYLLGVSAETLRQVPPVGGEVSLHAQMVVREDAMALYGFATEQERDLFELLVSVQGVGPKVALGVLSGGPPSEVAGAIAGGDVRRLQGAPGIGKRIAERIVSELRAKVGVEASDADAIVVSRSDAPHELARAGLVELGYDPGEADTLLRDAAGDTAEELLASALRGARG